jgi:anti-sigma B factor antagonist
MKAVEIQVHNHGGVCVVEISGEVRIGQPTKLLREKSKELLARGERRFVLDMLDVPWLDSSGLGEVFATYKRAREVGGEVRLVLRGK